MFSVWAVPIRAQQLPLFRAEKERHWVLTFCSDGGILILRMNTNNKPARRRSTQRERIYQIVDAQDSHPTAVQVYDRLRRELKTASLANVYRNLSILVEEGRLTKKRLRDGLEHFDAIVSPHSHFVCESCGAVSDIDLALKDDITKEARRRTGHDIRGHTIQFYGTCAGCARAAGRIGRRNKTTSK